MRLNWQTPGRIIMFVEVIDKDVYKIPWSESSQWLHAKPLMIMTTAAGLCQAIEETGGHCPELRPTLVCSSLPPLPRGCWLDWQSFCRQQTDLLFEGTAPAIKCQSKHFRSVLEKERGSVTPGLWCWVIRYCRERSCYVGQPECIHCTLHLLPSPHLPSPSSAPRCIRDQAK